MKVLIPIYPSTPGEESLLKHRVGGFSLALLAAKEICLLPDAEVHVFTTEEHSCDYSSYPIHHHRQLLRDKDLSQLAHLPLGTGQSIEYIKQHSNNPDETVLIVDYRTANITLDLINKAYRSYLELPVLPLLSIHKAKDNPAQFQKYYRILTMDILSVIDRENTFPVNSLAIRSFFIGPEPVCQTKSIPFDWKRHGFPGAMRLKEFFVRLTADTGYRILPFEKFSPKEYPSHYVHELYFKESDDTVRRFLQMTSLQAVGNDDIHAVSAVKQSGDTMCLLIKNMGKQFDYTLFLHANCWKESDVEIRLQPFSVDIPLAGEYHVKDIHLAPSQRPPSSFIWHGSLFYGPACTVQLDKQVDGFIVSVLGRHIGERADFSEPVALSDFCSSSPDNLRKVNKKSGLEITGRQTCPDFYETNSAFVFSRLDELPNLEKQILMGKTRGFAFDCVQIRTEFDALCAENSPQERFTHAS